MPRIGVIGCGYWGKNLLRNFNDLGILQAVSDLNQDIAGKYAEQYGVPALTIEQLINNRDIDAIAIATPAETHAEIACNVLEKNKHVFVEKPIALDVGEAEQLNIKARESGLILMVGHLMRYHPAFIKLEQLVSAGELGKLQHIYSHRLNLGKVRSEENILWSFAPHDISMILALVKQSPISVSAIGSCYLNSGIADVTTTHLSFPDGVNAHVFVSWLHPYKEQKLVVVGEKSMAVFDDTLEWERKLQIYPHTIKRQEGMPVACKGDAKQVPIEQGEPLRHELEHFVECIMNNAVCKTDADEAIRVLKVLDASERAMSESKLIQLS